MPTKRAKVSRTAPKKGNGFQFRWWMALVLVGVVAVIGVVILRFSHASGPIAQISCQQDAGRYYTHVSMTYNFPKFNNSTKRNDICMMSTSGNWRWGDYNPNQIRYNPGAAATYCVYGRHVGNVQFRIQARDNTGKEWPSAVSNLSAQDANVKGFGNVWVADPAPGSSGGPVPLACARIQTPTGASQGIAYEILGGNGLIFLDNIQVVDIHN